MYFIDTSVNTKGAIVDSSYGSTFNPEVKIAFSGSSSVNAKDVSTKAANVYSGVTFGDGVITNIELTSQYIPKGAVLASSGNPAMNYKVALEYARVRWLNLNGGVLHDEYVAIGDTPSLVNSGVISYLQSINGNKDTYYYDLSEITNDATVNLTPVKRNESSLLQGMNLATDFALELYILKEQFDNEISSVVIDGIQISRSSYTTVELNGSLYYKYRITRINPANAGKIYTVSVTYSNGITKNIDMSVVDYLQRLLITTSGNESEKVLAVKILKYIKSAYLYNSKNEEYLTKIDGIIKMYSQYDLLYGDIEYEQSSTKPVKEAIAGAQLYLSASARFRFVLNDSFTGMVQIEYLGVTKTFEVIDGQCCGLNYIQIELSAAELNSKLTITVGDNSINYNVSAYYSSLNTDNSYLSDMLFALNEYSKAAQNYIKN